MSQRNNYNLETTNSNNNTNNNSNRTFNTTIANNDNEINHRPRVIFRNHAYRNLNNSANANNTEDDDNSSIDNNNNHYNYSRLEPIERLTLSRTREWSNILGLTSSTSPVSSNNNSSTTNSSNTTPSRFSRLRRADTVVGTSVVNSSTNSYELNTPLSNISTPNPNGNTSNDISSSNRSVRLVSPTINRLSYINRNSFTNSPPTSSGNNNNSSTERRLFSDMLPSPSISPTSSSTNRLNDNEENSSLSTRLFNERYNNLNSNIDRFIDIMMSMGIFSTRNLNQDRENNRNENLTTIPPTPLFNSRLYNLSSNNNNNTINISRFKSKVVCTLNCKSCNKQVCDRGMKAILLADNKIELFSTDKEPKGVSIIGEEYNTTKCLCKVKDIGCLGCGNILGYNVTTPCLSCIRSCNNGHFWMFHINEIKYNEIYKNDNQNNKLFWSELMLINNSDQNRKEHITEENDNTRSLFEFIDR